MTTTQSDDGSGVTVREAVQADLLAVYRIERASFPQPWPFAAFERYLSRPGFLVAVDENGGTVAPAATVDVAPVIGYVVTDVVRDHGRPLGHVKDIAVHPDRRGEGVGRTLLERALEVCEGTDTPRVKLEVRVGNDPARSLYRQYGFEPLRRISRYYDDGEDALVMVRNGDPEA